MTDEELLRKLAEIEGYWDGNDFWMEGTSMIPPWEDDYDHVWNPLTNWSDCGPLVEKYADFLSFNRCDWSKTEQCYLNWKISWWDSSKPVETEIEGDRCPDLKRAICLAIIASKE